MLKVINLFVIEKIFSDVATQQVSSVTRMVYINCLIYYFKDKEATTRNATAFEIFKCEFDYTKFQKNFIELHKACLVEITDDRIKFYNTWGSFIDRTKLESVDKSLGIIGFPEVSIESVCEDLKTNQKLLELTQMKYDLTLQDVLTLIDMFISEQKAHNKTYLNESDCIKHCNYWIGLNTDKLKQKVKKQKTKILGK